MRLKFDDAVRAKKIRLTGASTLVRQFPQWLLFSPFASVPRARPST
jgi:hypothetical protein